MLQLNSITVKVDSLFHNVFRFKSQAVPENLNMAKMSLSSTKSEMLSSDVNEEDKNGMSHCPKHFYMHEVFPVQIKPFSTSTIYLFR